MKQILLLLLCVALVVSGLSLAEEAPPDVFLALQSGDYAAIRGLMDDAMTSALSEQALSALLPQLEALGGAYVGTRGEEIAFQGDYEIRIRHLLYERSGFAFRTVWREGKLAGMQILPEALPDDDPTLPESLREESISLGDPALPGTLTLPKQADGPLPAVILLHGSGPNDRDETAGQTKLFRDLAWGLAQKGVAVLRYDKRTYVYGSSYSPEALKTLTVREEAVADALLAAEMLQKDRRIDSGRIFLIGHSLGASISPRIAAENPGVFAGLILLSGTPVTLAELLIHQVASIPDPASAASQLQALRQSWALVRAATAEEAQEMTFAGQPAYYFWDLAHYDIAGTLAGLDLPVLIVNGGSDFQVTDADGIDAWRALDLPKNVHLSYHAPWNHLLMQPNAPEGIRGTAAEYDIPCEAPEELIRELSEFILQ